MKLVATIISRIFEPFIVGPLLTLGGAWLAGLRGQTFIIFVAVLVLVITAPAVLFFYGLLKRGHITDWDIHNRKERLMPLAVLVGLVAIDRVIVGGFHSLALNHMFTVYLVWVAGFAFITLKTKISGHSGVTALASGLLVYWLGWSWWPVLLCVPLVAWARLVRHDHTLGQVILGAGYSWMIVFLTP